MLVAFRGCPGRRFVSLLPSVVLLLLVPTGAFSQQPMEGSPAPSGRVKIDVVVSRRAGGKPVANLEQQDFTLLDNKVPRPVESFRALAGDEQPTRVILLVDGVNISYQNMAYERDQISRFLRDDGGKLALPTSLAIFTDSGTKVQQGFSRDGNALSQDLDRYVIGLRTITRSTGVYGAGERLQLSLTALEQLTAQEADVPGRKLILWVSPGWPLLSGPGIELSNNDQERLFSTIVSLSTKLRQAHITLYSVDSLGVSEPLGRATYYQEFLKGVSRPKQTSIGNLGLQVLALQSGGLALNSSDVRTSLNKCIADTTAYYQLTFRAQQADQQDEYHHLEIKLAKPDLVGRTRDGYYAEP